jgi:hypothetical protein
VRSEPRRSAAVAARALPLTFSLCLALSAAGCSSPQSFIVLVVESVNPTPIAHVAQLSVVVSKGTTEMKTLTFAANDLTILPAGSDAGTGQGTLSVGFSGGESGDVTFVVRALDAQGCDLGDGTTIVTLKIGASNEGIVELSPATACPTDGATPDTGTDGGSAFGGCDLVHPQCAVASQTCQVDCTAKVNSCLPGGTVAAGGVCQSPADCMPGTQCFDYSNLGCTRKICLPFCDGNGDCAAFAAGGAGPGSFCRDPVSCPNATTAAHTCTFSCDPTAAGTTGGGGCPSGLACLITGTLDQVDCACPEKTRTASEGQACASAANCAPGQQCNSQSGVQTCRPICRCDAANGSCTATTDDCPTAGTHCTPVSTETIYGICL